MLLAGCGEANDDNGAGGMAATLVEQNHDYTVYASHHQFYLRDRAAGPAEGSPDFWTREAFVARLAVGPGVIGIGTESYGNVRVALEVKLVEPPLEDLDAWDHVVEGPLDVTSGRMIIHGIDDVGLEDSDPVVRARQFTLPPGSYRVRVYGAGFATVVNEEGNDSYRLVIWPAPAATRRVLKQAPVPGGG
jgi:hypothetical protein